MLQAFQTALGHFQNRNLKEASRICQSILKEDKDNFDALHLSGLIAYQSNQLKEAERVLSKALSHNRHSSFLCTNYGLVLHALRRFGEALDYFDRAISINPGSGNAYLNRGITLQALRKFDAAISSFDEAISINHDDAQAHNGRGAVLHQLDRYEGAVLSYKNAIRLQRDYAEAHLNLGISLAKLERFDEAVFAHRDAIALRPNYAEAYASLGDVLGKLRRLDEAVTACQQAIALKPDYAEAYFNLGAVHAELKRFDESVAAYQMVIALKPEYAEAHANLASVLAELKRYDKAIDSYTKAAELEPDLDFLFGSYLHAKMTVCDWREISINAARLKSDLMRSKKVANPFGMLSLIDEPTLQLASSKIYARAKFSTSVARSFARPVSTDKIRIGYYSADFHNHATSYLIAELFEAHDRTKFELVGFSFGPASEGEMRRRVSSAFDKFIDVSRVSDHEVAQISIQLGIDIAVDLKGYTADSRTQIFAIGCAPIQVNYLGYPGSMGADFIDYILADAVVIPPENKHFFSEKIVYLPHSYQVNDSTKKISDRIITKQEAGLPETGFVFCCFNNNYKILPDIFDCWMRLLREIDGSVLWLLADNPSAVSNLRREAGAKGIDPNRLVFAPRLDLPEHLARHRNADLFLDTAPCNAHTTASDALWAGVPVLTLMGASFASRVAASLLNTIGLPELITQTQEEYEARAIELSVDPKAIVAIKERLQRGKLSSPLFNGRLFAKYIEAAYEKMYSRHQAGLPPDHIYIDP